MGQVKLVVNVQWSICPEQPVLNVFITLMVRKQPVQGKHSKNPNRRRSNWHENVDEAIVLFSMNRWHDDKTDDNDGMMMMTMWRWWHGGVFHSPSGCINITVTQPVAGWFMKSKCWDHLSNGFRADGFRASAREQIRSGHRPPGVEPPSPVPWLPGL